ncbi:hypothetical protein GCM10007421_09080 [Halopseudomonas oceani]|uniref:Lipoprotein n=1 Tax=Halopseudomonas oceani TaxID=1708783 RepID=A0A2P4EZP9_9GAMM|nr:hypothetical protein [Halopseudomonas oceani]POB06206.1 hypothetical protein C1949_00190 [Halopseudomonas oceani]GGE37390.1 hypothetical protein GCM10007421_09080 [Halopseudomonas oceani]
MKHVAAGMALLLSACATGVTQTPLETALVAQFGEDIPEHQRVLIDLNGDGFNDALIYAQGPDWCGSAGCTLFVYKGGAKGFSLLSRSTVVQLPLVVSAQRSAGWNDLIVHARGQGQVVLRATAEGYPLNPSLQPSASAHDLQDSRALLDYN